MKTLIKSFYYQFIIFMRLKSALFFIWVFPLLLFVIFGLLWGFTEEYIPFILTGVLGMTITSEGLYSIGPVVKTYYSSGLIKYINKMPCNISMFFVGYILSRLVSIFIILALLCLTAFLVFDFAFTFQAFLYLLSGTVIGLLIFGFIGLDLSFSGIKKISSNASVSLIGYFIIFTSNTFYSVKDMNSFLGHIGDIFPLNPVLSLMRGESISWTLIPWLVIPFCLFSYLIRRLRFDR